jgi:hypothetical protein
LVVTLEDVKFVPDLWINLFSIGKALKNGFNLGNRTTSSLVLLLLVCEGEGQLDQR